MDEVDREARARELVRFVEEAARAGAALSVGCLTELLAVMPRVRRLGRTEPLEADLASLADHGLLAGFPVPLRPERPLADALAASVARLVRLLDHDAPSERERIGQRALR